MHDLRKAIWLNLCDAFETTVSQRVEEVISLRAQVVAGNSGCTEGVTTAVREVVKDLFLASVLPSPRQVPVEEGGRERKGNKSHKFRKVNRSFWCILSLASDEKRQKMCAVSY